MKALHEATAQFLIVGEDASKSIEDFAEPIKTSNRYLLDVTIEAAARELGLDDSGALNGPAKLRTLQELGLSNWANPGGTIPRENWERAYGRFARELNLGVPLRIR